jgi:hypothetical protein
MLRAAIRRGYPAGRARRSRSWRNPGRTASFHLRYWWTRLKDGRRTPRHVRRKRRAFVREASGRDTAAKSEVQRSPPNRILGMPLRRFISRRDGACTEQNRAQWRYGEQPEEWSPSERDQDFVTRFPDYVDNTRITITEELFKTNAKRAMEFVKWVGDQLDSSVQLLTKPSAGGSPS